MASPYKRVPTLKRTQARVDEIRKLLKMRVSKQDIAKVYNTNANEIERFIKKNPDVLYKNTEEFNKYTTLFLNKVKDIMLDDNHPAQGHALKIFANTYALTAFQRETLELKREELDLKHKEFNFRRETSQRIVDDNKGNEIKELLKSVQTEMLDAKT